MKGNLQFDFIADKTNNTLTVRREFAAKRKLVWDCYTKSELLDQWFAPKPLTTKTKSMEFKEGGHWHYAMIEPTGTEHWGLLDYLKIFPEEKYTALDAFSNEKGELNPNLPRASWETTFKELDNHALVETIVTYNSSEELETVLKMGMKEGLTSTLERLDELLVALTK